MDKTMETKKLPNISNIGKSSGIRLNVIRYVQQYTDNTGIHGFKYIGEKGRSIPERLFWLISFGVCLYISTFLIKTTWIKWNTAPVLVSFSKTPTSIWKIPFPAVTICPHTKSLKQNFDYTNLYSKLIDKKQFTDKEKTNFSVSSLVCDDYIDPESNKNVQMKELKHIIDVAPEIKNIFFQCRWDLHIDDCKITFTKVLTEDGLCYTSNMLRKDDLFKSNVHLPYDMGRGDRSCGWSLENGYPEFATKDSFPRRAKFPGFSGSQVLVLHDFDKDLDYACKGPVQGFKIILHHPGEIPRVSINYLQASLDTELLVLITPDMMTTSEGIRNYDPHKRQCFFANEKYLSFFKVYTQQNCEFECLTNYTLKKCRCVAYYMPYEHSTPICGPGSIKCIHEAQFDLISQTVDYGISGLKSSDKDLDANGFACDCLPACSSLTYNAEFSQSHFNWQKVFEGFRENMSELPGVHFTRLTLFFKEPQFIPAERNELFGSADFLANCGGILGLFTGFSILSLVEIIYFLTLRLLCNFKVYGRRYWSGSARFVSNNAIQ